MAQIKSSLMIWTIAICATMCFKCYAAGPRSSSSSSSSRSDSSSIASPSSQQQGPSTILVVGSVNVDIIMEVHRLPGKGETTIARSPSAGIAVGGKGANQAVAAARLSQQSAASAQQQTRFICRFGNDSFAAMLERELMQNGVDVSGCSRVADMPSGHGMVMLEPDGAASSVVLGGSNTAWEEGAPMAHLMRDVGVVLLQREIPEHVNLAAAAAAAKAGTQVIQDVGGEDRPLPDELLRLSDFLVPNESELQRITGMTTGSNEEVIAAATSLTKRGARHVLVTLAERGAVLVAADGTVTWQEPLPVPGGVVVDGTAAGDAFRAGFAVALVEGKNLQDCLQFAAAAGAIAVSRMGAVPSLPSRAEVLKLLASVSQGTNGIANSATATESSDDERALASTEAQAVEAALQQHEPAGRTCSAAGAVREDRVSSSSAALAPASSEACPYKFASRLNSMKARRDLVAAATDGSGGSSSSVADSSNNVLGWVARQGQVRGLDLVDFNFPQHMEGTSTQEVLAALSTANLQAGAVCIRFPSRFSLGAFTNPDAGLRAAALDVAVRGCHWAAELGASELIVWSPYDGYDYHFQVDYQAVWQRTVEAFKALADSCPPGIRVSLEFKPTDESTRFSIVPSTGAALLLTQQVNRPNFGLTLDVGHLLMAGENPAQSIALVAAAGKLFGMQLNDAHVKLGAEDGLAFGSVNPMMALELVHWLRKTEYTGHIYFDTFPRNEDPVREAEYNIRQFKAFWVKSARLEAAGIAGFAAKHDAMGVLEMLGAATNAQHPHDG